MTPRHGNNFINLFDFAQRNFKWGLTTAGVAHARWLSSTLLTKLLAPFKIMPPEDGNHPPHGMATFT
jgi:hypothetical protein